MIKAYKYIIKNVWELIGALVLFNIFIVNIVSFQLPTYFGVITDVLIIMLLELRVYNKFKMKEIKKITFILLSVLLCFFSIALILEPFIS